MAAAAPLLMRVFQSIHKFLVYGMIHADSPNVAAALTQLASSVTHCTFDGE